MGATSAGTHGTAGTDPGADAPTRQMVAAPGASDRCTRCHAPLASDQRYCVNCGERRGKPRFSAATTPQVVETTSVSEPRRRPRPSSGSTLVAGIGTLLLAMGVGVLIGRANGNNSGRTAAATPPVQVVTVGGGGAANGSALPTTSSNIGGSGNSSGSKHHGKTPKTVKKLVITKKIEQKATAAAKNVLGGSANLAPPTVTTGQSCSNSQAGCQGGKFTGNFFGGG